MSSSHPAEQVVMDASWKAVLYDEFDKPYFHQLKAFLQQQKKENATIYPPGKDIFRAFNSTPFHDVRVVILGQDPYHGTGQAHGLSFSVQHGVAIPPSLRNMYEELRQDVGFVIPSHGNLEEWSKRGVLLLNAILTVRASQPGSHQGQGWETFTTAAIQALSEQRQGIVFMLWGRYAQEKGAIIDTSRHLVLKAAHPSPFSAHKGFLGCRHFSSANDYLRAQGHEPVNWQL